MATASAVRTILLQDGLRAAGCTSKAEMYGCANNTELFKLVAKQERVADALRADAHDIECAASAAEAEQRKYAAANAEAEQRKAACAAAAAEAEQRDADWNVAAVCATILAEATQRDAFGPRTSLLTSTTLRASATQCSARPIVLARRCCHY